MAETKQDDLVVFNNYITHEKTTNYLAGVLGEGKREAFITNCVSMVSSSTDLQKCTPSSIMYAAIKTTALNLPLDASLGMAYVLPFKNNKKGGVMEAQLQIGYKGMIALCHRTNTFTRLTVEMVYAGEIEHIDRLSGDIIFNWIQDNDERKKLKVAGVVAYFRLANGFEKTLFMSDKELEEHGKKYSQTYKRGFGLWVDNPIAMKKKTTLKLLLEKFAPKSTQLSNALKYDQSIIDESGHHYADNSKTGKSDEEQLVELEELYKTGEFILSDEEILHIERILSQKEVLSYSKAIKHLKSKQVKDGSEENNID
jgi:recombination protein RecT